MSPDLVHSLLSNLWSIFLVVLFFGGSIFVHELGHFLAARRRGVHVERFSIGFGPPIWSRRGRDGVEYRISWFPLGGYVLLPQLADLSAIEGESATDVSKLPPVGYLTKMIVFIAGAAFNILFAFLLACVIWIMGQPESTDLATTRIGYVNRKLELPDHAEVDAPAWRAGVHVGDVIRAIDGDPVNDWSEVQNSLALGAGRNDAGDPEVVLTLERDGKTFDVTVYPELAGEDRIRKIGVAPAFSLFVHSVTPGSAAQKAGLKPDDELLEMNHVPILGPFTFRDVVEAAGTAPISALVRRNGAEVAVTIPARASAKADDTLGLAFRAGLKTVHLTPFQQIADIVRWTFRTLASLLNPYSDIGFNKMTGAVGIVRILHSAAEVGLRPVLMVVILLNVNLAILNLMPIPVLDGGQMLFATVARIRGKPLPLNFIMTAQSVFFVLLISMVLYIGVFDVRRWVRDVKAEHVENAAAGAPAQAQPAK